MVIFLHKITPPLRPVSGMNGIITSDLQAGSVVIAIKKAGTRGRGKNFNPNRQTECKRVGIMQHEENKLKNPV